MAARPSKSMKANLHKMLSHLTQTATASTEVIRSRNGNFRQALVQKFNKNRNSMRTRDNELRFQKSITLISKLTGLARIQSIILLHKRCVCKPAMCPADVRNHYWKENENSRQFIWQNENLIVTNSSFDHTLGNNSII